MSIQKSFVLSAAFPSSRNSASGLQKAIDFIKPFDFTVIEYYCENCDADSIRTLMENYRSVFLGAALQKSQSLNLCSKKAADRKKAVDALAESFKFARQAGSESVLINSGMRPEQEKDDTLCLSYLKDSIIELHRRAPDINILLEPGDRDVEYRHLLGHTDMSVSFVEDIRSEVPCIGLVFDISHIAQLNEELYSSWSVAKKYCSHMHLANCVLNRLSPVYGDKHPLFSVEDGVYSHESAAAFFNSMQKENLPLTVGIEMICSDPSEQSFFERFASETDWFFKLK
jgi:sugar phosphate isomerase/epimerase